LAQKLEIMKNNKVEQIINALLKMDVDGETMQYIVGKVNLESQLLKQLMLTERESDIKNNLELRYEFKDETLKDFWTQIVNEGDVIKSTAQKVWEDLHNNDHLIYNTFEEYYLDFKNN
jgi:hypothetical protein